MSWYGLGKLVSAVLAFVALVGLVWFVLWIFGLKG